MAWIKDGQVILESSPCLSFNNLTSMGQSLAHAKFNEGFITKVPSSSSSSSTSTSSSSPIHNNNNDSNNNNNNNNDSNKIMAAIRSQRIDPERSEIMQIKYLSLNARYVLVIASTTGVQVFSIDNLRLINFCTLSEDVSSDQLFFIRGITCLPKSGDIIVGSSIGIIYVLELTISSQRIELLQKLHFHSNPILSIECNENYIVSADEGGNICVISADNYTKIHMFKGEGVPVTSIGLYESTIIASYTSGHIRMFRFGEAINELIAEICAHARAITAIHIHPHQPIFASCGEDSYLCIWSLPNMEAKGGNEVSLLFSDKCDNQILTGVQFLSDGSDRIATVAFDSEFMTFWKRN